ncbi:MAG: siderophore-interacting protein [Rhodococcus sp. (in: high G+C Gram-positive bacteria)]|nr:siderophore-interacting protein [Rhodococcus sp. (in: high G+C Gram-positive bacteria)]
MSEQPRGFYYADVVAVERLTVHMVRVTFGGEHVAGYRTLGVPDECVGVYFPQGRRS